MAIPKNVSEVFSAEYPKVVQYLTEETSPGPPRDQQQVQVLAVRIATAMFNSFSHLGTLIESAGKVVNESIGSASRAANKSSSQLVKLNARLFWATIAILALIIVLVTFGAVQLAMMWTAFANKSEVQNLPIMTDAQNALASAGGQ